MRKHQQRQILQLLETLQEAQDVGLYLECQQGAVQIGELIEQIVGEGTKTVSLLEEYCDLLFEASEGRIEDQMLCRQLKKIENAVMTELKPTRLEIVFFPYQISMFDSFRSVYLAAKADPDCDAYCVPIPWYERNKDGTFGEMHYDGDAYPSDIDITPWQNYDIAGRHPDAIFIHYPYDDVNMVTTIHPNYYSTALRQKTDCLVYIDYGLPYWMSVRPVDNPVLPIYVRCDLCVTYAEEFSQAIWHNVKRQMDIGEFPRQRINHDAFMALGSPKFDAVLSTRREDCALPTQWRDRIAGKKVLLYSTGVGAIVKENEEFLHRLRHTLDALRGRDDIVLWWRPHPFSERTFASMRATLYQEFLSIVAQYKAEDYGIYDDTPDFHRAIAWSDGCYTDESSLMFLYLATGKPFSVEAFERMPASTLIDDSNDYSPILRYRIQCMQQARGADIFDHNCLIGWYVFKDADPTWTARYEDFLQRFSHFICNEQSYPDAEMYRKLKLEMFRDIVANADGTAGQKIYDYVKQKTVGGKPQ